MEIAREIFRMVLTMCAFALGCFLITFLIVGGCVLFGAGMPCIVTGMGSFLFYYGRLQVKKIQGTVRKIDKIIPVVLFVSTIILIPLSIWLKQLPQS